MTPNSEWDLPKLLIFYMELVKNGSDIINIQVARFISLRLM